MATTAQPLTAENLMRLSRLGHRCELVGGELRKMPPAGNIHGKLTMRIAGPLFQHVEEQRLGVVYAAETGFNMRCSVWLTVRRSGSRGTSLRSFPRALKS